MKKFLTLALALAMVSSMLAMPAAAKDYADADEITYVEAVDVLSAIGVLEGDEKGFRPEDTLKRSEAAKIICALNLTPKTAASLTADAAPFADVPTAHWAAGYIAEGAQSGILAGVGGNHYQPDGQLTGFAYLKMLLVSLGYDAEAEGLTGSNWTVNVAKLAKKAGLTNGNDSFVGTKAVTREEAALYALNALKAETVEYDNLGTDIIVNGVVISTGASAAKPTGEKYMEENYSKLRESGETDAYGRPATEWTYKGESVGVYAEAPILRITKEMELEDVIEALEDQGYDEENFEATVEATKNGTLVEFFGEEKETDKGKTVNVLTKVVSIETVTAEIGTITADKSRTEYDDRAITIGKYGKIVADADKVKGVEIENFDEIYDEVAKGDIVLVTLDTKDNIATVEIPETVSGKVTRAPSAKSSKVTVDGTVYELSANNVGEYPVKSNLTVYLDRYGYAIASGEIKNEISDVVYLTDTYKTSDKYGTDTWYAQIVTADGEVEELVLAAKDKDAKLNALYTYTTNSDDEIELTPAGDKAVALSEGGEIEVASFIRIGGKRYYYADSVTMVYVDGSGSKLSVSASDELEKVAEIPANSYVVLNEDGEISVVYIAEEAAELIESEEVIYIADNSVIASDANGDVIEAYVDGELEEIVVDKSYAVGFYTYSVDKNDVFTLKAVKDTSIATVVGTWKDKFMTLSGQEEVDYVLADGAIVIDLTDNDIADVADYADAIADGMALTATVIFDKEDETVSFMVIDHKAAE